jgi:hypothetical protein
MRVYKTKVFARFARQEEIADKALWRAAAQIRAGNFDADLGSGVYKQRIARSGSGKSGGFRTILFFSRGPHLFFAHGYPKSRKANIMAGELAAFRKLAGTMLGYGERQIAAAVEAGELIEVLADDDADQGTT